MVTVAAVSGHPHTELTVDRLKHIGLIQSEQIVSVSVTVGQTVMGLRVLAVIVEMGVIFVDPYEDA